MNLPVKHDQYLYVTTNTAILEVKFQKKDSLGQLFFSFLQNFFYKNVVFVQWEVALKNNVHIQNKTNSFHGRITCQYFC